VQSPALPVPRFGDSLTHLEESTDEHKRTEDAHARYRHQGKEEQSRESQRHEDYAESKQPDPVPFEFSVIHC